jgi:hypothetical protein
MYLACMSSKRRDRKYKGVVKYEPGFSLGRFLIQTLDTFSKARKNRSLHQWLLNVWGLNI